MKACGIVAEYNPFHNGHLWHIEQAKQKSSADVMVIVMSGNFLQRGEPAIVDKWSRTEMALEAGADLVVELPTSFAVQPADFFARGAVSILHALNCSVMSFGIENGTADSFKKAGSWFHAYREDIDRQMDHTKNQGISYPAQMQQVIQSLQPPFSFDLSSPNNQLGFAYARENAAYKHPMDILTVPRKSSGYHDSSLHEGTIASATAIRHSLIHDGKEKGLQKVASFLPETTSRILETKPLLHWESFWPLLHYQLTVSSIGQLGSVYQMTEGIEHRIKKKMENSSSFQEFLSQLKTKRYTWTRLQRLMVYTLLQLPDHQMKEEMKTIRASRVLGFSNKGQAYLNQEKNKLSVPLVSNINQRTKEAVEIDIKAGKIYRLPAHLEIDLQDYTRRPIRV